MRVLLISLGLILSCIAARPQDPIEVDKAYTLNVGVDQLWEATPMEATAEPQEKGELVVSWITLGPKGGASQHTVRTLWRKATETEVQYVKRHVTTVRLMQQAFPPAKPSAIPKTPR